MKVVENKIDFPIGSLWIVGFSSAGVGGRPIILFKNTFEKNTDSWLEHRNLLTGEIITILDKDPSDDDEEWTKILVSGETGYILKRKLIFARRIDENR